MADRSPPPNPFDRCDDYILNCILAQIGNDPISCNNLRETCHRWRELIAAQPPDADSRSFMRTIYRAMKHEDTYFRSVAPALDRNTISPNVRDALYKSLLPLIEQSMRAPNSRIFRDIIARTSDANNTQLCLTFNPSMMINRWPDLEEIYEIFANYLRVTPLSIESCIERINLEHVACEIDSLIWDMIPNRTMQTRGYACYSMLCVIIYRRFFARENWRKWILIAHPSNVADLITAQDIAQYPANTVEDNINSLIIAIFGAYKGNIPRDITNALLAKFKRLAYWQHIPMLVGAMKRDTIEPYLREKICEMFAIHNAQTFAQLRVALLRTTHGASVYIPKWSRLIEAQDPALINNLLVCFTRELQTGFRDDEHARILLYQLTKLHCETSFLAQLIKDARIGLQAIRYVIREIAARNIEIRNARKYAHFFANICIHRETHRRTAKEHQLRDILRNPILRELYDTYGYIGV